MYKFKRVNSGYITLSVLFLLFLSFNCSNNGNKDEKRQMLSTSGRDSKPEPNRDSIIKKNSLQYDSIKVKELIRKVKNKDFTAQNLAEQIGSSASIELIKLTKHNDATVRELSIYCLDFIGGIEAVDAFIDALGDENVEVTAAAARALLRHPYPEKYDTLMKIYKFDIDEGFKPILVKVFGNMGPAIPMDELLSLYNNEKDYELKMTILAVLAKLGNRSKQSKFINILLDSTGEKRKLMLDHCKYINKLWLIKPLVKLLDDKSDMVYTGLDGVAGYPKHLRTCDIVVNLMLSIYQEVDDKKSIEAILAVQERGRINYSDQQIHEIKQLINR